MASEELEKLEKMSVYSDYMGMADPLRSSVGLDMSLLPHTPRATDGQPLQRGDMYNMHSIEGILSNRARDSMDRYTKGFILFNY